MPEAIRAAQAYFNTWQLTPWPEFFAIRGEDVQLNGAAMYRKLTINIGAYQGNYILLVGACFVFEWLANHDDASKFV